jgi:hypothetical protein
MISGPSMVGDERARWLNTVGPELVLDPEAVFPETTGFFVTRANDRRAKLLQNLKPVLVKALDAGEKVRYAARVVRYEVGEFMFSGHLAAVYSNQMALVLTDRRLLMLYVDNSGKPRDIKNQVRLSELCGAKRRRWGGHLRLTLKDGKILSFMSGAKADRKVLEAALPMPAKGSLPAKSTTASLEHLCPRCLKVVPGVAGHVPECPHEGCRIAFRSARKAAFLSLLVPGIGDIYLRHFFFGALEYLGSLFVLGVGLFLLMVAIFSGTAENWTTAAVAGLLLIVGPRIIDYAITLHMGRKGLVPLSNTPVRSTPPGFSAVAGLVEPRLPGFPPWAYALMSGAALVLVISLVAMFPDAVGQGLIGQAQAYASQGRFDDAVAIWRKAEADGGVNANERARLARDLYLAGDLVGGDDVLQEVGATEVEAEIANDINTFLAKIDEANKDYDLGVSALIRGDDAMAWPALDRALVFYRAVKRPVLPGNRDGVLVRVASEFMSAPFDDEDHDLAKRFAARVGKEAPAAALTVLMARLTAADGKPADAKKLLAGVDLAPLAFSTQLLALETQIAIDRSAPSIEAVATTARKLPAEILTDSMQARRAALLALKGDLQGIDPAVLTRAAEIAEAEDWQEALARLRAAAPPAELP